MEWLKSLLASWKVRVAVVGGALVVATTYGTCTLDPAAVSEATPTTTGTESVEVSTSNDASTTTATETTTETTGTENPDAATTSE